MAVARRYGCLKMLRRALGLVMLLYSLCAEGAVERGTVTSLELQKRIRSSFYLFGYCSSPDSPECSSLTSLLESSEALTRDNLVKTALLMYDASYWPSYVNSSTATYLWFACHDGQQIRLQPIDTGCSPGVPFDACAQLDPQPRLDLLMTNLEAAVKQLGIACIMDRPINRQPTTAATAIGDTLPLLPGGAAAADPETMEAAFLQSLDLYNQHCMRTMNDSTLRVFWGLLYFFVLFFASVFHMIYWVPIERQLDVRDLSWAAATAAPVASAAKLGVDTFFWCFGWTRTSSWWWALGGWSFICVFIAFGLLDHYYFNRSSSCSLSRRSESSTSSMRSSSGNSNMTPAGG